MIKRIKNLGKYAVLAAAGFAGLSSSPAKAEPDFLDKGMVERSFVYNQGLSSDNYESVDDVIEGIPIQEELDREATANANKNLKDMFGIEGGEKQPPYQLELNFKKETEYAHPSWGFEHDDIIPGVNEEGIRQYNKEQKEKKEIERLSNDFHIQVDYLESQPSHLEMDKEKLKEFIASNSYIDLEERIKIVNEYNKRSFDVRKWIVELPAYSLVAYAAKVFWHELGHARTAFYFGCKNIEMHGPVIEVGSLGPYFDYPYFVKVGSVRHGMPADMTAYEDNIISAAGVEATTVMAHYLYQSLKTGKVPVKLKPFVATLALFNMADRHSYLWSSAIRNYRRGEMSGGNDFHNVLGNPFIEPELEGSYVFDKGGYWVGGGCPIEQIKTCGVFLEHGDIIRFDENGTPSKFRPFVDKEGKFRQFLEKNNYHNVRMENLRKGRDLHPGLQKNIDIAYGVALGMSALELALRWGEIKYLVGTALGNNPEPPEDFEVSKAGLYLLPGGHGFFISIDGIHDWLK